MKSSEMPTFGLLQGVRVLNCGSVIAAPFACSLFADHGADVITVESARAPDTLRKFGSAYSMEHRNQRNLALNIPTTEGRAVITRLLERSDILIESSKAGTWDRWGLSDDVLWGIKPELVIVHVTGYGLDGDPAYVARPAYDMTGQAFSGLLALSGGPDPAPPMLAKPYTADYFSGMTAAWSSLAALLRARQTGVGESIDLAMFEAVARVQAGHAIDGLTDGVQPARLGNADAVVATDNLYQAKDGSWMVVTILGGSPELVAELGLGDDPDFADARFVRRSESRGERWTQALRDFVAQRTLSEALAAFERHGVGCTPVMTYELMDKNPHYAARGTITGWHDPISDRDVRGIGPVPRLRNNPGQVFRGSPTFGMDNEDILAELGYDEQSIAGLYEAAVLAKE